MSSRFDTKKFHVLFLPKWYPNKYDPMPGLFIKRHAMAVSKFCETSVLYVHSDDSSVIKSELIKTEENGIQTWRIYYRKSTFPIIFIARIINLFKFFFYHYWGIQLITKANRKPDLIHVNVLTRLGFIAWVYKSFTQTPYVVTEHWTRYLPGVNSYEGRFRKKITELIVKNAKAVMPVTENLMNAMQSHRLVNKNYKVVPNVVDTKLFHPEKSKEQNSIKKIVHLSCFTDEQKNQKGILKVIQKMSKIRQDFELHFIGDGADFQFIKSLSDDYRLNGKFVFFDGLLEGEELAKALRASDLMILFSHYENLPVVILESFACGVPVISSRVGGIHEHLNDERGALVEAGNEDQFLKTLMHELDQLNRFDKNKIRQYALDHFSKEVIGQQLYDIYAKII